MNIEPLKLPDDGEASRFAIRIEAPTPTARNAALGPIAAGDFREPFRVRPCRGSAAARQASAGRCS